MLKKYVLKDNLRLQVRLNDHDFVVGGRHNLIPSVYAVCEVTSEGKVSYSGDTHISIRSDKHDKSSAYTHHHDITKLFESGSIKRKPILVLESDGATDVAPRFPKTLAAQVALFKLLKLDALIHGVNAAGLSAFNPAERRMAPLSHDLAGKVHNFCYNFLLQKSIQWFNLTIFFQELFYHGTFMEVI